MKMFQFTIREWCMLCVMVATLICWWGDQRLGQLTVIKTILHVLGIS